MLRKFFRHGLDLLAITGAYVLGHSSAGWIGGVLVALLVTGYGLWCFYDGIYARRA